MDFCIPSLKSITYKPFSF